MRKTNILLVSVIVISIIISSVYVIAYPSIFIPGANTPLIGFERGKTVKVADNLSYGPYPTDDEFRLLKDKGFTTVVSFMSTNIPAENNLINHEKAILEEEGLKFVNYPLYPWEGLNTENVQSIKSLISKEGEKVYVHCYRGVHRVTTALVNAGLMPSDASVQQVSLPEKFERGNITKFSNVLYYGPYPTDEEFQLLMRGGFKVFVSLLSANVKEEIPWINKENEIANKYNLTLVNFPLKPEEANPDKDVSNVTQYLLKVNSPNTKIYVHDFLGKERVDLVYAEYNSSFYLPQDRK